MKILAPLLLAHYAGRATTTAAALIVVRTDGVRYGWTSHDSDKTILNQLCSSKPGLDITNVVIAEGAAVGNLELTTLNDGEVFTTIDAKNGLWKNALWSLHRFNWEDTSIPPEPVLSGITGNVTVEHSTVTVELLDLRLWLSPSIGAVGSLTCRYEVGVNDEINSLCPVNLLDFTEDFTVTDITNNQTFRDSSFAFPADWFTDGILTWETGENEGLIRKVKISLADGTVTLTESMILPVAIGDTAKISAGCLKRYHEDCIAKYNVGVDFGGEPHMPAVDDITQPVEINV